MNQKDINDQFNALLKKDSWWSKYADSQFVAMIALFVGQMVYRCWQYATRALQEGFISTALKRSSILAAAEDRGYVGRRIAPSTGMVSITNLTAERLQLPIYSTFESEDLVPVLLTDAVDLAAGETKSVSASQLEVYSVEKTVDAAEPFFTVMLSKEMTAKCHSIDVYVTEPDGTSEQWEKSFMFRNANNTSNVYTEFYKPTEQIGIRFGDGSTGRIPPTGSVISLDVWCTQGQVTIVEGQKLIPVDELADYEQSISVVTASRISGGTPAESTEETRARAQYFVSYDEQIVWGDDYVFYLKNTIGGMSWLRCWGEEEQESYTGYDIRNINRIFLCGHKPGIGQEQLHLLFLERLAVIPDKMNKRFSLVPVNYSPISIRFIGKVPSTSVPNEVELTLKNDLDVQFGRDSFKFDTGSGYEPITKDKLWAFIESLGIFTEYELEVEGSLVAANLEDFIYLDTSTSTFDIAFKKNGSQ
ncbi:hypothetical protein ASU80_20480 [Enterobacter hormaechei subsp. xiangfangensis]|uniref:hypothetical protein n=1 Tax=Enterobacter hormaechei TaxID=158836 RepID=UPI000735CBB4|nr:hypothetical protein [Enterobacter hormaechei]KTI13313.1 hypothetical protein ASV11_21245 [Enterobacter hormaechei subsp. xiangfangensis]KTJ63484.1 hypothetical protein ASU80_20480 [Enterobacter hormaechei subsp. xiangfangensis]MDR9967911.1 hypothetical protein [Enterobacter hormaechei subsp. xiangfangensis]